MSLTDREELELRVKALEDALAEAKKTVADRAAERSRALDELSRERDELKEQVARFERELAATEANTLPDFEREKTAVAEAKRVRAHLASLQR